MADHREKDTGCRDGDCQRKRYHPVRDFLNALQWDGIERIRYCLHRFLGADADDYTCEAMRLFLLGAISRAFRPGCKFEIMLCLVGGQGAGKSSFFRLLAVQDDWFSDDLKSWTMKMCTARCRDTG